ncbi:Protein memo1 [Puccinia graminis f. sp. tritici]|uniref:Protein memo1 n=1 Tax=Puccinia graminis f. sp. tritici TaxID=56615 RepID=A0A5B0RRN8_PUCGR|nr:Protein memo1 [Puccinia graminis f. sp. tritici]KAA1127725.1 Protein memo1 [Puccinia graminis f. sp. tritici]
MAPAHPDIRADADIRLLFPGKPPSASAGGYPPALAGIRAGIFGYPTLKAVGWRALTIAEVNKVCCLQ